MKPELDFNLPLIVSKPFLANGRKLKAGDALNWKKAGITVRRMKQLYEQGWIHHANSIGISGLAKPKTPQIQGTNLFTFDGTNGQDESLVIEPKKRGRKPKVKIDDFSVEKTICKTIDEKINEEMSDGGLLNPSVNNDTQIIQNGDVINTLADHVEKTGENIQDATPQVEEIKESVNDPEVKKPVSFWGDV
ncbi:MAG: hypothetical protein ABFD50_08010 [Smithella sp.]